MTITNVDLLPNSSNYKAMLPEHWNNIPRIYVWKIFQGYPKGIVMLWKFFYEVKKVKKNCSVDYPIKIVITAISSLEMF